MKTPLPELPPDVIEDLLGERVRWSDIQAAAVIASVRSWDECDFDFIDDEAADRGGL